MCKEKAENQEERSVNILQQLCLECIILLQHYFYMATQTKSSVVNEDDDQYFLQPMLQKLPPKELISQKYSPDVVPQVKLMQKSMLQRTQKDKKSSNTNFIPPKIRNSELEAYAANFNIFDYLGNNYTSIINQVVYLKFNNIKYNLVPQTKHKTRVMPAFYVPFQQIYSEFENNFTKNMGLSFPETHNNAVLPTSKCNKGCSFDPIFWSNYQTGNLFAAIRKNSFEYDLILQNDINSCRSVGWFNFSVEFLQEGYYSFRIKNITTNMSKLFKRGMKISYCMLSNFHSKPYKKAGEDWGLCGENITFSLGNIQNELRSGEKYYQLSFEYRCKNKHEIVMFALQCPYSSLQAQRFYQTVMFKKVRGMTQFQRIQYGKTISGNPLSAYLIKKKKSRGDSIQISPLHSQSLLQIKDRRSINLSPLNKSTAQTKNKSVIVIGRLGAADVSSSFIIEGMMDYLVDCLDYDSLKKTMDFYFFPFCNIDGAKYGNDLTNLTGTNLKGDWRQVNKIYNGQIYYLKETLAKINKQNPISLILSLVPENEELFSSVLGFKNENGDCEDSRIFPFVLSKRNRIISFENSSFFEKNKNNSMCCVLGQMFSNSLIYQFNVSHFQRAKVGQQKNQPSQQQEYKQCSPDSYRGLGKEIISNYLEHVKLYDKNILLRDKWLKEILQIQECLDKKGFRFSQQKPVEERFSKSFYQIQSFKDPPSLFQMKSSNNLYNSKQKRQSMENSRQDLYASIKKEKGSFKQLPRAFNDLSKPKRFNDTVMETATQIIETSVKEVSNSQTAIDKPISLFRIAEKKTSILKNCIPNMLNFEMQNQNKEVIKKSRQEKGSRIDKQPIRKELSSKYLRKIKVEQTMKRRMSRQKLGYIVNNI